MCRGVVQGYKVSGVVQKYTGAGVVNCNTDPGVILPYTCAQECREDTALEAFRHNPTVSSFAPPCVRSSACTKCPNLRFLSY